MSTSKFTGLTNPPLITEPLKSTVSTFTFCIFILPFTYISLKLTLSIVFVIPFIDNKDFELSNDILSKLIFLTVLQFIVKLFLIKELLKFILSLISPPLNSILL